MGKFSRHAKKANPVYSNQKCVPVSENCGNPSVSRLIRAPLKPDTSENSFDDYQADLSRVPTASVGKNNQAHNTTPGIFAGLPVFVKGARRMAGQFVDAINQSHQS
jgi:hypothetical protein